MRLHAASAAGPRWHPEAVRTASRTSETGQATRSGAMRGVDMSRDRTAIVTGAGSPRGIGREACLRLAAAGWSIAARDLDEAAARETAALGSHANGGAGIRQGWGVTKSVEGRVGGEGSASGAPC